MGKRNERKASCRNYVFLSAPISGGQKKVAPKIGGWGIIGERENRTSAERD